MKIITKLVIFALISTCSTEVYNWNVRTLENNAESDTDFGDELKLQSALSNELQRDLLKISGKVTENSDKNTEHTNFKTFDYELQKDSAKENVKKEEDLQSQIYDVGKPITYDAYSLNSRISKKKPLSNNSPTNSFDGSDKQFNQTYQLTHENEKKFTNGQSANDAKNHRNENQKLLDNRSNNHNEYLKNNYNYNYDKRIEIDNPNPKYYPHIYEISKDYDHLRGGSGVQQTSSEQVKLKHNYEENEENINEGFQDTKFYLMTPNPAEIENFLGSNLFDNIPRKCFTRDDIILLRIRKDFENLIPKSLPKCLLNDRMLPILMNYFYICHQLISTLTMDEARPLVLMAFFDTLGGYLNYYLVPVAKYSYYAGKLSLDATKNILRLHQQCKNILNTNGNGWKAPMTDVLDELNDDVRIEPLLIDVDSHNNEPAFCMQLDIDSDYNEPDEMIVSLPKLAMEDDENGYLDNLWLPFRHNRVHNLKTLSSAYILVEFYYTVTKCYQFEHEDQDCYNSKLREWLSKNIMSHLSDNTFYPGLGAVLRVYETLRRKKKRIYWEADYDGEENRKKKSYPTRIKSKLFLELPQNYDQLKENHKIWQKNKKILQNVNGNGKSSRKKDEFFNGINSIDDFSQHQRHFTEDQLKLAAAIIEEQAKANNQTSTEIRLWKISPIQWIIIITSIVLFLAIIIICCLMFRKKRKKQQVSLREHGNGGKRKSKQTEEEIHLLNANSKSVVHGNYNTSKSHRFKAPPHMRSVPSSAAGSTASSSSSLLCQLPAKCFAIKRSGPAIIETTSLDYSSSEAEDKATRKVQVKAVKIDDKLGKHKEKDTNNKGEVTIADKVGKDKKSKETPKK